MSQNPALPKVNWGLKLLVTPRLSSLIKCTAKWQNLFCALVNQNLILSSCLNKALVLCKVMNIFERNKKKGCWNQPLHNLTKTRNTKKICLPHTGEWECNWLPFCIPVHKTPPRELILFFQRRPTKDKGSKIFLREVIPLQVYPNDSLFKNQQHSL